MKQSPLLSPRAQQTIRLAWWMIPGMGLVLLAGVFLLRNPDSVGQKKPVILVREEAFPAQPLPFQAQLPEIAATTSWQAEVQQLRQIKELSPFQKTRLSQLETADSLARIMEDLATRLHLRREETGFVAAPYQRALEQTQQQFRQLNLSTQ